MPPSAAPGDVRWFAFGELSPTPAWLSLQRMARIHRTLRLLHGQLEVCAAPATSPAAARRAINQAIRRPRPAPPLCATSNEDPRASGVCRCRAGSCSPAPAPRRGKPLPAPPAARRFPGESPWQWPAYDLLHHRRCPGRCCTPRETAALTTTARRSHLRRAEVGARSGWMDALHQRLELVGRMSGSRRRSGALAAAA